MPHLTQTKPTPLAKRNAKREALIEDMRDWCKMLMDTQPRNLELDDDTFEGGAYFIMQRAINYLTQDTGGIDNPELENHVADVRKDVELEVAEEEDK